MKNYLVNKSTKAGKFWQIELKGTETISTYGKLNTTGKETVKDHKTVEKAFLFFKTQSNKKILGGYSDPTKPFVALEPELSQYNELTFYHNGSVDTIHYIKELDCIISGSNNTFYLFTTDGEKLDEYQFQESKYFHG
ncbi:MAG: putative DNA-binding WGR domain protein, partial [Maribacter sp.]